MIGQRRRALDAVLQFPHVPRPAVTSKRVGRRVVEGEAWTSPGRAAGGRVEELAREQDDLVRPIAQRGGTASGTTASR